MCFFKFCRKFPTYEPQIPNVNYLHMPSPVATVQWKVPTHATGNIAPLAWLSIGLFWSHLVCNMITSTWWKDALKSHSYVRPMAYNNWQPLWLPKVKSYISRFWVLTSFWWVYRRNTSTYIYCTCLVWRNHF